MTIDTLSKDPANNADMGGAIGFIVRKMMQQMDTMLPAQVISYDREKNTAVVRPIVAMLTTEGNTVQRATVANVTVLSIGGGGFVINFPLQPGDLGWIEANDRDISLMMQSLAEAQPNTLRMRSFEDARFIPDIFRQYTIAGEDADRMVIQSTDGATRIAIGADTIVVEASALVRIKAPNIQSEGAWSHTGNIVVDGQVTANGIPLSTHKHTGVQTGGGTSGGPTP